MKEAVIVTGCGGGIGSALVQEFSNAGFCTIGIDRNEPTIEPDHFVLTDLRKIAKKESAQQDLKDEIRSALTNRKLCVLVNNAAVQNVVTFEDLSLEQIRESFDVNVIVPFVLSQMCFDDLKSGAGMIINIGSVHARLTKPGFTAYSTSKGALESMTRALAVEIGANIRVNAIIPAAIETAMLLEGFGGSSFALDSLISHHPVQQLGTPTEVATLAVTLAKMKLPFLNGSIIDLSGGISSRLHDPS